MKITIELEFYTLEQAKERYRTHFAYDKSEKVTKSDLAGWFGSLIQADIDDVHTDESDQEENEY